MESVEKKTGIYRNNIVFAGEVKIQHHVEFMEHHFSNTIFNKCIKENSDNIKKMMDSKNDMNISVENPDKSIQIKIDQIVKQCEAFDLSSKQHFKLVLENMKKIYFICNL